MDVGAHLGYFSVVAALEGLPGFALPLQDDEDLRRVRALPPEAYEELQDLVHGRLEHDPGDPCIWLDTPTRRCRFYAHRPTVCRGDAVTVGNSACWGWREHFGIGGSDA
jgi:hypothetical protein